jgi:predicted small secreted protein
MKTQQKKLIGKTMFPHRRRLLQITVALAAVALTACGATIGASRDTRAGTRPVFLLDHGRHSTLVLTRADGTLVRYLYGDWRWYAEGDTGVLHAVPTLFAPTPSALGRQVLTGPATDGSINAQVRMPIHSLHRLAAPAAKIDSLDRRLAHTFEQRRAQAYANVGYAVEFVPGERPYTLFHNSNHVVAGWLRELGIEVRGNPVFGSWRVASEGD